MNNSLPKSQVDSLRPALKQPGWLLEILKTIVFVLSVTILFDMAVPRSLVEGHSMQPNFYDNDRLVVSRLNYLFDLPQRGDVLVFNSLKASEPGVMLIKRVIGLPGDTVEIRDQMVYVNGLELDEPYINEPCLPGKCSDNTWVLGPGEYFMMGDNRNHSSDSRSFGPVPYEKIVGEVLFRYWPPSQWGAIMRPEY